MYTYLYISIYLRYLIPRTPSQKLHHDGSAGWKRAAAHLAREGVEQQHESHADTRAGRGGACAAQSNSTKKRENVMRF